MPDMVVLEQQVVAAEHDAHPRSIVNEVVRGAVAHAVEHDSDALLVEHADMVDIVVLGDVARGHQPDAVSSTQRNAVRSDVGDVVADDQVVLAVDHPHRSVVVVAHASDRTAGNRAVGRLVQDDGLTGRGFEGEAAKCQVGRAGLERDHGLDDRCDDLMPLVDRLGRPEVEPSAGSIEIPFTGSVQLFEGVANEVAVAGPDRVRGFAGQSDRPACRVHLLDRDDVVPPVVAGEDKDLDLAGLAPGPLVARSCSEACGDLHRAGPGTSAQSLPSAKAQPAAVGVLWVEVGIARQGQPLASEEEFLEHHIREPLRFQVGFEDVALVHAESGEPSTTPEDRSFARVGTVDDGRRG